VREDWDRPLKRGIDLVLSGVGLLIASPLLAIGALLVYLEDRGPVVYRQTRVGRGGRLFEVVKLRSMRVNTIPVLELGQIDESHPLVSRTGRVLRRFKIDEILQLLNVLRGEMSLVGPRPSLPELVAQYDAFQRRRLSVPPGITGWAQVNGGIQLSWDERIVLDIWYLDHWTLALDAWILLKTVGVLLFGERLNAGVLEAALAHARRMTPNPAPGVSIGVVSAGGTSVGPS
jgi:lipopolysaccharide/colanic/teichoic acid biosynthesis glycosyltransferase